jgi:hypothetical protein
MVAVTCYERNVEIRGVKYKMIIQNGEPILRRFDEKHKIWVTLRFSKEENNGVLDKVANLASNLFAR